MPERKFNKLVSNHDDFNINREFENVYDGLNELDRPGAVQPAPSPAPTPPPVSDDIEIEYVYCTQPVLSLSNVNPQNLYVLPINFMGKMTVNYVSYTVGLSITNAFFVLGLFRLDGSRLWASEILSAAVAGNQIVALQNTVEVPRGQYYLAYRGQAALRWGRGFEGSSNMDRLGHGTISGLGDDMPASIAGQTINPDSQARVPMITLSRKLEEI